MPSFPIIDHIAQACATTAVGLGRLFLLELNGNRIVLPVQANLTGIAYAAIPSTSLEK